MTLRKCNCGHLWKDRVTSKLKAPERCPECRIFLKLTPMSRIKIVMPTRWLMEQIRKTVEELNVLPWGTETEEQRIRLQSRLELLKTIEGTFVMPEEELLDADEKMIFNAEPEFVATVSSSSTGPSANFGIRKKEQGGQGRE